MLIPYIVFLFISAIISKIYIKLALLILLYFYNVIDKAILLSLNCVNI